MLCGKRRNKNREKYKINKNQLKMAININYCFTCKWANLSNQMT